MSASVVNRNNVLAGAFVIGSLALAVAIAFILSDVLGKLGEKREFVARFPTSVGVTGLQPGAPVTFAGLPVGAVVSIEPHSTVPGTPADAMDVRISLDSRVGLYEDAFADLAPPLLGGVSRINFPSAGQGTVDPDDKLATLAESDGDGLLEPGEVVRGRFAPSILAQLGFTVEDAERIRNAIADVEAIARSAKAASARIDRLTADIEPRLSATVGDAQSAVAGVRAFTDRLNAPDGWAPRIDRMLTDAEEAVAQAPALVNEAKSAVATARSLLETHTVTVGRILADVQATTERVRFVTMEQAEALLAEGTLALAASRGLIEDIGAIVIDARPEIDATLANARSISQQARLFLDEVRAQPWRLLNKPSEEDLQREPLYAAARVYAAAVADLRAASEALDSAVQGRGPDDGRPSPAAELTRVAAAVEAAYDRYAEAERALLETLRASDP